MDATMMNCKAADRHVVETSYAAAEAENRRAYGRKQDVRATEKYIYDNQKEDATVVVHQFHANHRRVVSVTKKTKVGADGLMIEIARLMTTHPDDDFVTDPGNVRIITGMNNASWEKDMKDKAPSCFKDKIFHHGQLKHSELSGLRDALIIVDELDTGDKEYQVLHNTLKAANMLDIKNMEEKNIRFVFISATMIKELYHLYRWGEYHFLLKMTIPRSYIGHSEFLERGIIKEFYPLTTIDNADKWIKEDIIDEYGNDFRIHLVRANQKTLQNIQAACTNHGVEYRNHTSTDRIDHDVLNTLFKDTLHRHVVLIVKGFFRRANLIPNEWKLRIGATHEQYIKQPDTNAQVQSFPGRMTGYWRDIIEAGHKTGPYRTSINAIEQYEIAYNDPFGMNSYHAAGFNKVDGRVTVNTPTFVTPKQIAGLVPIDALGVAAEQAVVVDAYRVYDNEDIVRNVCKALEYRFVTVANNHAGFKETSLNKKKEVCSLEDAVKKVRGGYGTNNGATTYRTYYPCYENVTNPLSLRFVLIIRPGTDEVKLAECDARYPSIM
jgi:hypothetical protein